MASIKKLFSLDENIVKELDIVAVALHKSQKEVVEAALDYYFDYTDGIVADKITQDIKSGNMKTYDSKDVYKELGIEL
jgi:predicted transcriptional regulator